MWFLPEGRTIVILFLLSLASCKPLAKEETPASVQVGGVANTFKRLISDGQFNQAREVLEGLFDRGDFRVASQIKITNTDDAEMFLRSYTQKDIKDVEELVAEISDSEEMARVLSLLRDMTRELPEVKAARAKRLRAAAMSVFSNNYGHYQEISSGWNADFVRWLALTKQKLTQAVSELLDKKQFTQTTYTSKQEFDKAKVRIEKTFQKVIEAFNEF